MKKIEFIDRISRLYFNVIKPINYFQKSISFFHILTAVYLGAINQYPTSNSVTNFIFKINLAVFKIICLFGSFRILILFGGFILLIIFKEIGPLKIIYKGWFNLIFKFYTSVIMWLVISYPLIYIKVMINSANVLSLKYVYLENQDLFRLQTWIFCFVSALYLTIFYILIESFIKDLLDKFYFSKKRAKLRNEMKDNMIPKPESLGSINQ